MSIQDNSTIAIIKIYGRETVVFIIVNKRHILRISYKTKNAHDNFQNNGTKCLENGIWRPLLRSQLLNGVSFNIVTPQCIAIQEGVAMIKTLIEDKSLFEPCVTPVPHSIRQPWFNLCWHMVIVSVTRVSDILYRYFSGWVTFCAVSVFQVI